MAALGVIVFVLVLAGYAALEAVARGQGSPSRPATTPADFDMERVLEGWSEAAGELAPDRAERPSNGQGVEEDEREL